LDELLRKVMRSRQRQTRRDANNSQRLRQKGSTAITAAIAATAAAIAATAVATTAEIKRYRPYHDIRWQCFTPSRSITTAVRIYRQRPWSSKRPATSAERKTYVIAVEETTKRSFARSIRGLSPTYKYEDRQDSQGHDKRRQTRKRNRQKLPYYLPHIARREKFDDKELGLPRLTARSLLASLDRWRSTEITSC
jgi:hypothetical protein